MRVHCVIRDCSTEWDDHDESKKIPMFKLPKSKDLQNRWFRNINQPYISEKLRNGHKICIKHFEDQFIQMKDCLVPNAVPTIKLNKGNTLIDYEELLSRKSPPKKKRGTSGLMNLQIARRKKLMRKERMQRLAEIRRRAKLENPGKENDKASSAKITTRSAKVYEPAGDFFLGEREETNNEKIVISLRLTSLMKHLHDGRTTLTKHPSSIRDAKIYPMFNKIRNVQELNNPDNPVFWNKEQVRAFLGQLTEQKGVIKKFETHDIDGESLLNLDRSLLASYMHIEESLATSLGEACEQLKKETIMRYVNS